MEWFLAKRPSVTFRSDDAADSVSVPGWTHRRRTVTVDCSCITSLSIDRVLAGLVDRPDLVLPLMRGLYTKELDEDLKELGVELYPIGYLFFKARGEPRGGEFTNAEKMYLVLCVGEKLIESGKETGCINGQYSWRCLRRRGFSSKNPLGIVIPYADYVFGKLIEASPPVEDEPLTREGARRMMLGANPPAAAAGGTKPAWMQMIPRYCMRQSLFGLRRSLHERETLAKLAGRAEKLAARMRTLLNKDEKGLALGETPWAHFRRCRKWTGKKGRLLMTMTASRTLQPHFCVENPANSPQEPLPAMWLNAVDCVLELISMPRLDAETQPDVVVFSRAAARFAMAFVQGGAVMPVPLLFRDSPFVTLFWVPRLDVPAGEELFREFCRLARPFSDCLFPFERMFEEDETDSGRKNALCELSALITAFMERAAGENLVSKNESDSTVNFIAMRDVNANKEDVVESLTEFFGFPLAIIELPGRPAFRAARADDGSLTLECGVIPCGGTEFVGEKSLSLTNRLRLTIAILTALAARAEDFFHEGAPYGEKCVRTRPAGVTLDKESEDLDCRVEPEAINDFIISGIPELRARGVEVMVPDDIVEIVPPEL